MGQQDNVCVPVYEDGDAIPAVATAAITGKRVLAVSADMEGAAGFGFTRTPASGVGNNIKVAHAAAAARGIGVSSYDAAIGERLYVLGKPGQVVPITAGAAIAAGADVEVGTTGKVITLAAGKAIGICVTGAANGADAFIKLY